jgi:hypothetical protein
LTPNDTKRHQHEKIGLKKLENLKMADSTNISRIAAAWPGSKRNRNIKVILID